MPRNKAIFCLHPVYQFESRRNLEKSVWENGLRKMKKDTRKQVILQLLLLTSQIDYMVLS